MKVEVWKNGKEKPEWSSRLRLLQRKTSMEELEAMDELDGRIPLGSFVRISEDGVLICEGRFNK